MSKKNNNYKFRTRHKEQSPRQQRVCQLINSAIIGYLRKGSVIDVRLIGCPITITKVTISPDLKIANCFFLPFNTKYSAEEILEALVASCHVIRKFTTSEINMKYSPEIRFYIDKGFENSILVDQLLDESK